jgi:predicted PurR-regulated permease PerM
MNGVVIGLGALVLGVPLAVPIALVNFVTSYIPFYGAFFAGAFAVLVALGANGLRRRFAPLGLVWQDPGP